MSNGCKACKMGPGTLGMPLRNVSATHTKALPLGCVVALDTAHLLWTNAQHTATSPADPAYLLVFSLLIFFILPMLLSTQRLLGPHQTFIKLLTQANILAWDQSS